MIGVLTALLCACSGSDGDEAPKPANYSVTTVDGAPSWQIDWQADEARPDWREPDVRNYENWSIMKVQIGEVLRPYTSTDDRMALFVGNDCRGVQGPALILGSPETNTTVYLLKVWGNESDGTQMSVTLKYYSARLKQTFSRTASVVYRAGMELGVSEDFVPAFTLGSSKYPVVMTCDATPLLSAASLSPVAGDIVAAFVGDECRGVRNWADGGGPLTVYGRTEGESVTLKFYQASSHSVYSFPNVVSMKKQLSSNVIY